MNYSHYHITLDNQGISRRILLRTKEGENAKKLCITLTDGSLPYVIGEDCTAWFRAHLPDGGMIYEGCEIENNTIVYTFQGNMPASSSPMICEVVLENTGGLLLISPSFLILVEKPVIRVPDGTIAPGGSDGSFQDVLVEAIRMATVAWLEEHPMAIDATLTQGGQAAEALAVGGRFAQLDQVDGGLSDRAGALEQRTLKLEIRASDLESGSKGLGERAEKLEGRADTLEKKTSVAAYTDPTAFGSTADASPEALVAAMPNNSMLVCTPENLTHEDWDFPDRYGFLQITKSTSPRAKILLLGKELQNGDYQLSVDSSGKPSGTWYKMPRMFTGTVTLRAGEGWTPDSGSAAYIQQVDVPGVLAEGCVLLVQPTPDSWKLCDAHQLRVVAQAAGKVTFGCDVTMPVSDLTVRLTVLV